MIIIFFIALFTFYIAWIVFYWSILIRRAHDLGHSGWLTLLFLVPLVNIGMLIYFLVASGEEGANMYGTPVGGQPFWRSIFRPSSLAATSTMPAQQPPAATPPAAPTPIA